MRAGPGVLAVALAVACGTSSTPITGSGGGGADAGPVVNADAGAGAGSDAGVATGGGGSTGQDAGASSEGGTGSGGGSGGGASGAGGGTADAGNGGAGGGNAGGGGTPDAGVQTGPVQMTSDQGAFVIAIDDRNVYWGGYTNTGGWQYWHYWIRAIPKSGGDAVTLAEGAGAMLSPMVAVDGFVYWSMATCPLSCDTNDYRTYIYRVPREGGPLKVYAEETSLGQLASDGQRIYYRARWSPGPGGIWSVGVDGLDVRQLTTTPAGTGPVLVDGRLWFFDTGGDQEIGFSSTLSTVPAAGGDPRAVRTEYDKLIFPVAIVVNAGTAFTVTGAGVWRVPLDGTEWQVIWRGANIAAPDANGGRVYFGQSPYASYTGCLGRANADGTDASCIDSSGDNYGRVRVDDATAFFVRNGNIWRLPR